MSEVTEVAESSDVAATESASPTEGSDDFAADLGGDTSSASTASSNGQAAAFDPSGVTDWARQNKSDVPTEYHAVIEAAKSQQADYTRKTQDLADQRRQFEQQQQTQQQQILQTLQNQINTQQQPQEDPYADLRARLGPDDSNAIDVVRQIIKTEMGTGNDDLKTEMGQLKQGIALLAQQQQVGKVKEAAGQLQEARDKYGEALDPYAEQIKALIGVPNKNTGANYTVTEAYETVSGVKADEAAALRQADQNTRRTSKRQASGGGQVTVSGEGAPLSDGELVTELKNLGFE